jgi:hypothetical protein
MLTIVAGAACVLLNLLYVNWIHLPIESVAVILFFIKTAPCAFILGMLYTLGMKRILNRKQAATGLSPAWLTFTIGALATILFIAIMFPCDVHPYFVGGYLIEHVFATR